MNDYVINNKRGGRSFPYMAYSSDYIRGGGCVLRREQNGRLPLT